MHIKLTVEAEREELDDVLAAARALKRPAQVEVHDVIGKHSTVATLDSGLRTSEQIATAAEGNGQEAPKRRGRPPKSETPVHAAMSPKEKEALTDPALVAIVTEFCKTNTELNNQVAALLKEFNAERVSQVPPAKRSEFLSQLENLAVMR